LHPAAPLATSGIKGGVRDMADEDEQVPLTGKLKEKLVEAKQGWAKAGRLLTGTTSDPERDRLPPGQRLVTDFPVLDLGVQPDVSTERFRLRVEGLVEAPLRMTWDEFMALPQTELVNDIHCVTQWSRYDNTWQGVSVRTLLELARPKAEARFVSFTSYDGYTTNVSLEDFDRPENLLAHHWEGKPLERQHGGPLRVVIPHLYFWKSPKWITRIELLREDRPGFWEVRGYNNHGDPWLEERYS
jgi:DMSO/TMAO reductase YedYZ molybdopterin-dependent catalytic subunit